jgi:glycerol-3-phosphate dehydrogenase (NAD(P)+)
MIAVVGGGSWGTALAAHLARLGHAVPLWMLEADIAKSINDRQENPIFLPSVRLPATLRATTDLADAVSEAQLVVSAVPSAYCRPVFRQLRPLLRSDALIVSATKGLERDSLKRMSEVAADEIPQHTFSVLSGPSFAREVAEQKPTAVVVASAELERAETVQRHFSSAAFRVYTSADVVGVELGGALKNVIAIAAGIVQGMDLGHNALAALITRGLAEITRLAVASGARAETLSGLAGLGDLVLTCTGGLSRNRQVGLSLAQGKPLNEALAQKQMVAEGVFTTSAACALAARMRVVMPIAAQMQAVINNERSPQAAAEQLMLRTLKRE